jgi:transcriptional regulator with XRE-family HTH domain
MRPERAETVGERVHRLRKALGLTQRDLAEPHYTPGYVSAVESGRRSPSVEAMRHFAERLGLAEDELATGRSPDRPVELDLALLEAAIAGDARRLASAPAQEPRLRARALIDLACLDRGSEAAAGHYAEAAVLLSGEPPHIRIDALAGQAAGLRRAGEIHYARHLLRTARDELRESGHPDPVALLIVNAHLTACDVQLGDGGAATAAEALALAMTSPDLVRESALRLARTLVASGHFGDAAVAMAQARAAQRQLNLNAELALCYQARGNARRGTGRLADAVIDLGRARDILASAGYRRQALEVATELADAHRLLGQGDLARALAAEVVADAEADSRESANAHRQLGLLAKEDAELGPAEHWLATATTVLGRTGPRHEYAQALLDLTDVLAGSGATAEAAAALSGGLRTIEHLSRPPIA